MRIEIDGQEGPRELREVAFFIERLAELKDGDRRAVEAGEPVLVAPWPPVLAKTEATYGENPTATFHMEPRVKAMLLGETPAPSPVPPPPPPALVVEGSWDGSYRPQRQEFAPPAPTASPEMFTLEELAEAEDVDSAGATWDAALHSSSKAKVADGTWRKRKGLAAAPPPPPPPGPLAVPTPPVSSTPPPPPPGVPADFTELAIRFAQLVREGKAGHAALTDAVRAVGLENPGQLIKSPDLVPAVWEILSGAGAK